MQVCDELGLFDALGIDPVAMRDFAVRVEGSYLECPYHNKRHAAAVTLVLFQIVLHSGIMAGADHRLIGPAPLKLYILAAVIAASVHDVRHPGVGSDFRVRTVSAPHSSPTTTIPRDCLQLQSITAHTRAQAGSTVCLCGQVAVRLCLALLGLGRESLA